MIEKNPKVFKADSAPEEEIELLKIPGYTEGIRLEVKLGGQSWIDDKTAGGAQEHTETTKKAYQTLVAEGKARKIQPGEKLEWIAPSKLLIEHSRVEIATDFRGLIRAMEREKS